MKDLAWIAVDWGTSRLRAWAMAAGGRVLAEASSDDGMNGLAPDAFEPALLRLIGDWTGATAIPVLACGMVGARQGWRDAGYAAVPARPADLRPVSVPTRDPRLRMMILPGLSQAAPPDVMRGEETQIAGFLAQHPEFDGVLCLPGTHAKWVRISAGEVVGFTTAMTGELYALLAGQSVLRHAVAQDAASGDHPAFEEAVADMISEPERLAQRLFSIRARSVLEGLGGDAAGAALSGLLIGAELAATRGYWLGQAVAVAGEPALARLYARALAAQGVAAACHDAGPLTRLGLQAAFAALPEPVR